MYRASGPKPVFNSIKLKLLIQPFGKIVKTVRQYEKLHAITEVRTAGIMRQGFVSFSSNSRYATASSGLLPHISSEGFKPAQKEGLAAVPKSLHLLSSVSCTHLTPAGLPSGIPGIGEFMDGAMQHAPQPGLHSIAVPSRQIIPGAGRS